MGDPMNKLPGLLLLVLVGCADIVILSEGTSVASSSGPGGSSHGTGGEDAGDTSGSSTTITTATGSGGSGGGAGGAGGQGGAGGAGGAPACEPEPFSCEGKCDTWEDSCATQYDCGSCPDGQICEGYLCL